MADDRYSTITREVPVDRPWNTVFASTSSASGELNSQHRVSTHPAGFRVRERGAIDATVVHAYRCPVHGNFEARCRARRCRMRVNVREHRHQDRVLRR
jgi:hypothetical protein